MKHADDSRRAVAGHAALTLDELALESGKRSFQSRVEQCARPWMNRTLIAVDLWGAVARLVGIEGGVVSEVINLESSGVEAPDRRPRHDEYYHGA